MFSRTKKLEKRIKALEAFLGLVLDDSDPNYLDYNFEANEYNAKLRGVLGELVQESKQKKKNS